jgi:hypothetical protein
MRNLALMCVLAGLSIVAVRADTVQSWTSGKTTVTLKNGTLTVSGNGAMEDYGYSDSHGYSLNPWKSVKSSITGLVIDDGVTSIGRQAFMGCTSLTSVTIPYTVTSIGQGAFERCHSLMFVTIPNSVTSIGHQAFIHCISLTSVTIPGSVTAIGHQAFAGCTSLTSITIAGNVTTFGSGVFDGCTNLMCVTIKDGMTVIGTNAFSECTNLTSVTIPNSLTTIESGAFKGCTNLKSITIPSNVIKIGESAFLGCTGLVSVIFLNPNLPDVAYRAFGLINRNACLYVPASSIDTYCADDYIRYYFDCIKPIGFYYIVEPGAWLALGVLSALLLSAAVFVIVRKSRKVRHFP